jgi:hypothetical protein
MLEDKESSFFRENKARSGFLDNCKESTAFDEFYAGQIPP